MSNHQLHRRVVTPESYAKVHSLRSSGKSRAYIVSSTKLSPNLVDGIISSKSYGDFYAKRTAYKSAYAARRRAKLANQHKVPVVSKHVKAIPTVDEDNDRTLVRVAAHTTKATSKRKASFIPAYTKSVPRRYKSTNTVTAPTAPELPRTPAKPQPKKAVPAIQAATKTRKPRTNLAEIAAFGQMLNELKQIRQAVSKPRSLFSRFFG